MKCNDICVVTIVVVAAMVSACASTPDTVAADSTEKADEQVVCVREKQIGSHIPRKVCRSVAQIEKDSEAAHEAAMRAQQQSSIQQSGTTGN